jgi:GH24 family phage-related lysozyme (muramidase)
MTKIYNHQRQLTLDEYIHFIDTYQAGESDRTLSQFITPEGCIVLHHGNTGATWFSGKYLSDEECMRLTTLKSDSLFNEIL